MLPIAGPTAGPIGLKFFVITHGGCSLGARKVPHKIWARSVQPFWSLLDTIKQTNTQTDKLNLYIDNTFSNFNNS